MLLTTSSKRTGVFAGVELHGLIEVLVLLLDVAIVGADGEGVARVLVVHLLELQLDGGEQGGLGALLSG